MEQARARFVDHESVHRATAKGGAITAIRDHSWRQWRLF
jgi:hypothetical protein